MVQSKGVTCVYLKLDFYHGVITSNLNRFKFLISIDIFCRAFLGSVSDYCAHKAKCPVIIVKKHAWQVSYGTPRVSHFTHICNSHIKPFKLLSYFRFTCHTIFSLFCLPNQGMDFQKRKKTCNGFWAYVVITHAPKDYANSSVHRA